MAARTRGAARRRGGDTWRLLAAQGGLLAWALHFTLAYGAQSALCARAMEGGTLLGWPLVPAMVVAATLLCLGWVGIVAWRAWQRMQAAGGTGRFLDSFALGSSLLAAIGILYQALPALLLPSCV
jgi:hypothetical protein